MISWSPVQKLAVHIFESRIDTIEPLTRLKARDLRGKEATDMTMGMMWEGRAPIEGNIVTNQAQAISR